MNNAQHRLLYYLAIPFLAVYLRRHFAWSLLRDPLLILASAFLAWAMLSLLWSDLSGAESLLRGLKTGPLIGLFLLSFAQYTARDPAAWERLLRIYVSTAVAVALLLLLVSLPEMLRLAGNFRLHGFGQGRNPNDCGRIFAAALLLLLSAPRQMLALPPRAGHLAPLLTVGAALLLAAVVYLSGSRGAALGLVASLGCLFALKGQYRAFTGLALAVALLVLLVLLEVPLPRLFLSSDNGNGRLEIWQQVLALWGEAPLIGKGVATVFSFEVSGLGAFSAAHSVYLGTLLCLGLLGLLIFLALLAAALLRAVVLLGREGRSSFLALLVFCAISMAFSAQTYYVQLYPEWFWFWIPIAGLAGLEHSRRQREGTP